MSRPPSEDFPEPGERPPTVTPGVGQTSFDEHIADLHRRVHELEVLLEGASRIEVDGHDTLRLEGMNLQVTNGSGDTGTANGVGNVIIGYSAQRLVGAPAERTGSHYLVVGDQHAWTGHGGMVAGLRNSAGDEGASVIGGRANAASGRQSVVVGGVHNNAGGSRTSVSAGSGNRADGLQSSVSGGAGNIADGLQSAVTGGFDNTACGSWTSVSGGRRNTAGGRHTSVLGGSDHRVDDSHACHPDCSQRPATSPSPAPRGGALRRPDRLAIAPSRHG